MDFNEVKNSYRGTIEQTIAFAGKGLDFYTDVKAAYVSKIVRRHFSGLETVKLLDIGCGHGLIHPKLLESRFDVVGVEVAHDVLPMAQAANPKATYLPYDGHTLPFPDRSFDVAIAICVMHHVPVAQWGSFLVEMRRVIRPGGIAVVFEHNPLNPLTQYVVASNEIDDDANLLYARSLRRLMSGAGFDSPTTRGILFTPFGGSFFRGLDEKLGWLPFGAQYYAVGFTPSYS